MRQEYNQMPKARRHIRGENKKHFPYRSAGLRSLKTLLDYWKLASVLTMAPLWISSSFWKTANRKRRRVTRAAAPQIPFSGACQPVRY